MNILILNWRDIKHPLAGGAEQSLNEHAKFWIKKGATVTWISSRFKNSKKNEIIDGVKVVRLGSHFSVHLLAAFFIRKLKNIDIIIDSFHFIPYFSPLYFDKNKIIALINEPAKNAWFKNIIFPISLLGYVIEPFFFKLYSGIKFITSADSISNELVKLGIAAKRIHIIPHGVTIAEKIKKYNREIKPTILYLSQLSPDKGIEDALHTFSIMQKNNKDFVFWVVGKVINSNYSKKLQILTKELNLQNIQYFGYVPNSKKYELFQRATLLVHPSIREGWGLNIIEGNFFGLPAIGYNVTGLRDSIKNNVTGLLTASNTPIGIAEKCLDLIKNKKIYKKMSLNSILWASNFSWDKSGQLSWELINKVYEKSKK